MFTTLHLEALRESVSDSISSSQYFNCRFDLLSFNYLSKDLTHQRHEFNMVVPLEHKEVLGLELKSVFL